ncbi:hypothetical protein HK097_007171 [Rhizophlyctis rosea]|uniref:Peptidase A1 domain-containing protein n=1 Tax=Rhizophlyctis rosea TaxID=64517 RepID=A0AAD5SJX8_9FUNG|nr:hypothetical protein HK097_007171 [Rhizophlyctis rosea]
MFSIVHLLVLHSTFATSSAAYRQPYAATTTGGAGSPTVAEDCRKRGDILITVDFVCAVTSDIVLYLFDTSTLRKYKSERQELASILLLIQHDLGASTGTLAEDSMTFGSLVANDTVFVQTYVNGFGLGVGVDGVLGLAFSPLSWAKQISSANLPLQTSPIETLYSQNTIPSPSFALHLTPTTGELALSAPEGNPSRYTGNITWLSVPGMQNWWHVGVDRLTVGGVDLGRDGVRAVLGSASPLITTDYDTAKKANTLLGAYETGVHGIWDMSCDSLKSSLLNATFTLGNVDFTLRGADLLVQVSQSDTRVCFAPFMSMRGEDDTDRWTLGQIFLRKFYSIYDYNVQPDGTTLPRVGLARAV